MAVSKRLRFEILRRDGFRCRYCGLTAADVELRVDHVIPVALGGRDEPSNLVTACEPCNSGKSSLAPDSPLVDDVAQAALRWRAAMDEARCLIAADRSHVDDARAAVAAEWDAWMARDWRITPLPSDWVLSVEAWVKSGLYAGSIPPLVEAAMLRPVSDRWRYFCGVVWSHLEELRERTLQVVETDPAGWVTSNLH